MTTSLARLCLLCLLSADHQMPATQPADETSAPPATVTIRVASGRTFTGNLSPRTSATALWLRTQQGATVIARPIQWDHVAHAEVLGHAFSGEEFQQAVEKIRQSMPSAPDSPPNRTIVVKGSSGLAQPSPQSGQTAPNPVQPGPVRHLDIDASVGYWSDTAEADGLVVYIYPVDARGELVPLAGTLEVDLTGVRTSISPPPQPFFNLGRWTCVVRPDDFGPRGAVYRLPFQAVQPEFDTSVAAHGAVHARLSVPGQGTFDASQSTVRIRPGSPFRDALQRTTGERFLPQERLGRVR